MTAFYGLSNSPKKSLTIYQDEKLRQDLPKLTEASVSSVIEVDITSREFSEYGVDLAPVDKGRQAWTFVFSACIFDSFIWGWNNTYGIFQDYYSTHPPFDIASSGEISIIGTASVGIQYIEVVLVIALFQRYPELPKPAMWASLGIVFGIGAGVFYAPILMWLSDWFVMRRGLAGGIIFGGSGIGGFVLPIIMGYLLDVVGFGWTIRIFGLVLGVCGGIALLGVNPRFPVRKPTDERPRRQWFPRNLSPYKNPVFLSMFALEMGVNSVQALGFYPVSIFLPTYTSYLSVRTFPSTMILALFNAASVVCYILFGRICDSYPYPYIILMSGVGSALAAFLLWGYASTLGWMFAFSIVFGGFNGGFPGAWPAAASEIGGSRNDITSLMMGTFAIVKGVGAIVGPIIAASLRDINNDSGSRYGGFGFLKVEIFVGSMAVATSVGALILSFISESKRKSGAHS
ncbi:hypothetical protein CVT25_004988 [Psilocybe cyanescens]|uniref:Major facilitator superfamily (MFS) profile domain-containing protein n=1 Tax=Psilocybe cyanescens TaxID=93625 RepID=A0A409X273_PSICY|nr:hypothetical protein CVT25_004988 [Psilocybe cyanescens]